ncbi:MAG: radical SAM protein [Candidatus ainarchaeum sp.]|nr:radical SAM protein [Candidatus ainarchaeum sp.]MDD3975727.1 radical SAM protein [Candidatus ainarchaeum sp.]
MINNYLEIDSYKNNFIFKSICSWGVSNTLDNLKLMPFLDINSFEIPFVIIFKITKNCNLNCKYCYSTKNNILIKDSVINSFCKMVSQYNKSLQIIFHGGEPLLEFDKIKSIILKFKNKKNITFSIQTNGTLLNRSMILFLKKYNVNLSISIDGPKIYNDVYRIDFSKVSNSIKLCHSLNFEPTVISVLNYKSIKNPEILFNFYKKFKIKLFKINLIDSKKFSYDSSDLFNFYKKLFFLIINNNLTNSFKIYELTFSNLLKKLLFNIDTDNCNKLNCGAGTKLIAVNVLGDIYPCDYFLEYNKFKMGNINKFNINNFSLNNIFIINYFKNISICNSCIFKNFLSCNCFAKSYFFGKKYCVFWKELIYFIMLEIYSDINKVYLLINSD